MPEGRFGLDRPLAESLVGIQYAVLTKSDNIQHIDEQIVVSIAEQALTEVVMESANIQERIAGSNIGFDSNTDNLFITTVFKNLNMNVEEIIKFTKEHYATLLDVSSNRLDKELDSEAPNDIPPNDNIFHLIKQPTLERNIVIKGR